MTAQQAERLISNPKPDRFSRGWMLTLAGGLGLGSILGAIGAVNFVILAGPDSGYESLLGDIFSENFAVGVAAGVIWFAGPVVGAVVALKLRSVSNLVSAQL